jgi:hypothetical protein
MAGNMASLGEEFQLPVDPAIEPRLTQYRFYS